MSDLDHILGNEALKKYIKTAVGNNKISHAYLLEGEKGSGKKMISAAFSKILQCEQGGKESCGYCTSCIQIDHKDHPDVIWISHEKPNVISVSEIREQLVNTVDVKPYKGPYKIYIIDEAEKMNMAAQNVLLKTIEEPPEYAIIMLLTSNKGVFLPTILSRCIGLSIKPIHSSKMKKYLMDTYKIDEKSADFYAGYSMGNLGKAVEIFSSEEFNHRKELVVNLLKEIYKMSIYEIFEELKELKKMKEYYQDIFDMITIWYHDLLVLKAQEETVRNSFTVTQGIIFSNEFGYLKRQKNLISFEGINKIITGIESARKQIYSNVNADAVMELLFFEIKKQYE